MLGVDVKAKAGSQKIPDATTKVPDFTSLEPRLESSDDCGAIM